MKPIITRKSAFTLIELLVVIAIIALLLAILIPSLSIAKKKASGIICMTNVKNISLAWFSYKEDNKAKIPSSLPVNIGLGGTSEAWIGNPVDAADVFPSVVQPSPPVTDADEIRGIERGVLFPYLKTANIFHCPFDRRKSVKDLSNVFRTYSIPDCLYGYTSSTNTLYNKQIRKFNEIKSPGTKVVLVEEVDERNFNYNGWTFATPERGFTPAIWNDPLGVTHGDSSTLGFCDAHAENRRWVDASTKARTHFLADNPSATNYGTYDPRTVGEHTDVEYMYSCWPYRP